MAYKYHSRRSVKRLAKKSRRNFLITIVLVVILSYFTLTWILPNFIGGLGFVTNILNPAEKPKSQPKDNLTLAPPVLNIPYEATNSSEVNIKGFTTPNSKVTLYIDDELKDTVDADESGSFTFKDVSLNLGTNNIYGKTLDDKENESLPSKLIKLIFDNEKPSLNINEPEDNKKIQGGDKKVKVSGKTEPGTNLFISGTQVIVNSEGNFSTEQPLNDGDNSITIKAVDKASNTTEEQRTVTYTP
ncbi:MAG: hypothetical protein NUV73_04075 [Candidatus Daviesbacteria bacterium]|nr:hypothetical protein [Candidatus Daviesbacteria bacterium]